MSRTRKIPFKPFAPKPGAPGSIITIDGRDFVVWSAAPAQNGRNVWAMPADERDTDAAIYRIRLTWGDAEPYHTDGTPCCPTYPGDGSVGSCQHHSHRRAS